MKKSKRKICVVVTARPSYSRIKSVLTSVKQHPDLTLQLVISGTALLDKFGKTIDIIKKDGFKIDEKINSVVDGGDLITMAKTTGLSLIELSTSFQNLKPDVVVTIADRYETIATAIAASYMNIPLAHVQGGEVTGSIDEKVRHSITKLSDVHFVSNDLAMKRLLKMGEDKSSIYNTGCPSIDLIEKKIFMQHKLPFDPIKKYGGVGSDIDISNGYLVVMQHPVTTEYDLSYNQVTSTLEAVSLIDLPVLWFWPNVDAGSDGTSKGIRAFREWGPKSNIRFFKNMEPLDFLSLLKHSKCIIGNSSVAIRECAFMGVPAVNIGSRQEGRLRGSNTIDVDYEVKEIEKSIHFHIRNGHYEKNTIYGDGKSGKRIVEKLARIPLSIRKKLTY